ncbi:acyltransferase [Candidatus Pelagibacter sp.]|nr:acyltransferase [Candidatus Pelagibacter sp.]
MKNFYRKEIDGLRALGVIGVIIYHLEFFLDNKQILPGGFLGVDIFFVVSGYLITKILHDEYNLTGSISFINFYFRRAKRLLPALIFVIFFSNFFAYKLLFPSEYDHYIKSVISSLFFVSNIFFHYSGQNYGESVISEKPLLHTWSLGVEEQFYIFFPIFLIFTLRFLNKYRVLLFILFIVFSFFLCFKISSTHPSFNFYFLTSRAWELLAGGLIVFINKYFEKFDNRAMSNLISLIGLSLIIISFFKLDDVSKHPSTYTIIPVIGCFLILLNNDKNNYIKKFLSLSLFRGIGLISYSLYLWHYPIFVFGKISNFTGIDNQNLLAKLILLLAAFIISIISYFFIEKFFRKKINFKIINFIIGILSIYFLCIFSLNILKIKHEKQFPLIAKELKKSTWFETKQYFRPCFQRKKYFCSFNNQSENSVFLIGDSIMASLQNELKKTLISKDFQFITMTNAGCDFIKISDKDNQNIFCNSEIYKERLINIKKKTK